MKKSNSKKLTFISKLENIAVGMQYFAVSVPAKISQALATKAAVPVSAKVQGSEAFIASLYPVGGGRHYMRVKNKICSSVGIKKGSRVRVEISVRDRSKEIAAPKDLKLALKAKRAEKGFKAMPPGKKSFLLRKIAQAATAPTRAKRIQEIVAEAARLQATV